MLNVCRHRHGTAADLARLLACWLAAILLLQGLAATLTHLRGPAHRHAASSMQALGGSHAIAHATGKAHHHAIGEVTLPADGEASLDAAALLLLGTLAFVAVHFAWPARPGADVRHAAAPWAWQASCLSPPRKPPRG